MLICEALAAHRDAIVDIAARHGAHNVRVFGSVARGEANDRSDVDFLVRLEPGRSLLDVASLWLDLQDLLGCSVDIVTEGGLKGAFRETVLREAVDLEELAA